MKNFHNFKYISRVIREKYIFTEKSYYPVKIMLGICFFLVMLGGSLWPVEEVRDGFTLVSTATEKSKYWKIEGSTAVFLPEDWISLTDVRAILYDKKERKYHVRTPKAKFHRITHEMITDEEIHIWREGLTIDAIGMHMRPEENKVVFKKNVNIETYSKSAEDLL